MLVLWDHRSERSLTLRPRGPELARRLMSSVSEAPPVRWQVVFSGLPLVYFCFIVQFVMLSLFHIPWAFPSPPPLWSFSNHSSMVDSVAILMSDAW